MTNQFFTARINTASFYPGTVDKPSLSDGYYSISDFFIQCVTPLMVLLQGLEEFLMGSLTCLSHLLDTAYTLFFPDTKGWSYYLSEFCREMSVLMHKFPFVYTVDLLLTTLAIVTRTLSSIIPIQSLAFSQI